MAREQFPPLIFLGLPKNKKPFSRRLVRVDVEQDGEPRHLTLMKSIEAVDPQADYMIAYFLAEKADGNSEPA